MIEPNILNFLIPVAQAAGSAEKASPGVLGTFGVNWQFFVAQLINFAVVIYVLKRWVFGPVSKRLTERTEKIEIALKDAEEIEKEKQEFDSWKEQELSSAQKRAGEIIAEAEKEAASIKDEALKKTKEEQKKIVAQAKEQIAEDEKKMMAEVKTQLSDLVTIAAEKVIKQKLDDKKDKELIKESIKNL